MRILLINFILIVWTYYGVNGIKFAVDEIMTDYSSVTMTIGGFMGKVGNKRNSEDLKQLSKALNKMASLMQGISGPSGAPPFVDEKVFMEVEQVFARMGPYICLLPYTTPKTTDDLAPVLSGMLGGLIGSMVGEERLNNGPDARDKLSLLTGLGTIAGALGGMAGFEVERGAYGMPNASYIVNAIPKFVAAMGDMKKILHGSFEPLMEKKHENLRLVMEFELSKALRKMSVFLKKASSVLTEGQGESLSYTFDTRFHGLDSETVKCLKAVCAMSGIYGGIIGYILPRFHEEKGNEFVPDRSAQNMEQINPRVAGTQKFDHIESVTTEDKVIPIKKQLISMRSGRLGLTKESLFGGIYDELSETAGEVGGYSGVIGGMMAEVLANGAHAQVGEFLHWDLKEEEVDGATYGSKISSNDIFKHLQEAIPDDGIQRLPQEGRKCLQSVSVGLEHFSQLHKYGSMLPGSLDYKGPYGSQGDSVSSLAIERRLSGSQWAGSWKKTPVKFPLSSNVAAEVLNTVFSKTGLEDNAVIVSINNKVQLEGAGSNAMQILRGKIPFEDAKTDDMHSFSIEILAAIKPSVISSMSPSNLLDVFTSEQSSRNPERLKKFLASVTDQQIKNALFIAIDRKKNGYWNVSRHVAGVVADDLVERFGLHIFNKICPFAFGISAQAIEVASPEIIMDTDLLSCLHEKEDDLSMSQKKAIIEKVVDLSNLTVNHILKLKGFAGLLPSYLWETLKPEDFVNLMNNGVFSLMTNMIPIRQQRLVDIIIDKLELSSSHNTSAKHLRSLGLLMCGVPAANLNTVIPSIDLEDIIIDWTDECITKHNIRKLKNEKACSSKHGDEKKDICYMRSIVDVQNRRHSIECYNSTRPAVKEGLKTLTGTLPLTLATCIDGLSNSELSNIDDNVLLRSLHLISSNNRLTMSQKRKILKKLLNAGYKTDNFENLSNLNNILEAIDISSVNASLMEDVFRDKPSLLEQFSVIKQTQILLRLLDIKNYQDLINSMTSFSYLLPTKKLHELFDLNWTAISRLRWTQSQGMIIIEKYKMQNNISSLTIEDLRKLGRASIGITCDDVARLPMFKMVELARMTDSFIGNDISPALASCIATKLFLFVKTTSMTDIDADKLMGTMIPANILLFMPSTILASLAYGKHCTDLFTRLGRASINLLSPGPGQFAIEGILEAAKICFLKNSKDDFTNQEDSVYDLKNKEYDYEKSHAETINMKHVKVLGKLACSLQNIDEIFNRKSMSALAEVLSECMESVTQATKRQIDQMSQKNFAEDFNFDADTLKTLGPILLLIDPEFIQKNLTSEEVGLMAENIPPMEYLLKKRRFLPIVGDKTSHNLTFEDILLFEPTGTTNKLVLDFYPVDFRPFADVVYPKLKEHINRKYNSKDKDNEKNYLGEESYPVKELAEQESNHNTDEMIAESTTNEWSNETATEEAVEDDSSAEEPQEVSRKKRSFIKHLHRELIPYKQFFERKQTNVLPIGQGKLFKINFSQMEINNSQTSILIHAKKQPKKVFLSHKNGLHLRRSKDFNNPTKHQSYYYNLVKRIRKKRSTYFLRNKRNDNYTVASSSTSHVASTTPTSSALKYKGEQMESTTNKTDYVTSYELFLLAGPAIIGMPPTDIERMSEEIFKETFALLGRNRGWTVGQLKAMKNKMFALFGEIFDWSSSTLQDMGHIALMLNTSELKQLNNLDLEAIYALSLVEWPSNEYRKTLLYRFINADNKSFLSGLEVVAVGNLLCGINLEDVQKFLDVSTIQFAIASIGKLRCFEELTFYELYKRVKGAFSTDINSPSFFVELGVFAAALDPKDFKEIAPDRASFIAPEAIRLVNAASVHDGWNESHLALMGPENGAAMLSRPDIIRHSSSKKKNAIFRSAFGSSAGLMSTLLYLTQHGEDQSSKAFNALLDLMMDSVTKLFNKMVAAEKDVDDFDFFIGGPWSVYGLEDPDLFIIPPPPEFSFGLSKEDFSVSFESKYLEDDRLINFLNDLADASSKLVEASSKLLDVMMGETSFNELNDFEIKEMPCTIFLGLKEEQIQEMSPKSIGSLLDSEKAARDPLSMSKVIEKIDTPQFEEAMGLLNNRMTDNLSEFGLPWKPPIHTQKAMTKNYLNRLTTDDTVSDTQVVDKFIKNICSMVAGLPPNMIGKIPQVESKKKDVIDCMSNSYEDLTPVQKKEVTKWALGETKEEVMGLGLNVDDIIFLGEFLLDLPLFEVRKALEEPDAVAKLINSGNIQNWDPLHSMFSKFSKMITRKLLNESKELFNSKDFLDKLGSIKCDIPLKKVVKSMNKETIKHLANYSMMHCKNEDTMLEESLEQCHGAQAMRLQRCQLLHKKRKENRAGMEMTLRPADLHRQSLDQFKMMREMASTLLEGLDLAILGAEAMMDVAGALSGLTPVDMKQIPDSSVLQSLGTIKNNQNLTPKQKKIMLEKAKNAGFSLNNASSISELGELVTEIPTDDFAKMPAENIKINLKDLKKKASSFSPSQKRAIVDKLQEGNAGDLLNEDLGAFASDIPLKKLDEMKTINFSVVGGQAWDRDQAAKMINIYRNASYNRKKMNSQTISDLGTAAKGLNCTDIMELDYYEVEEAATSLDSQTDLDPDMDECLQSKLHFTKQVVKGKNYLLNKTDPDLETTFETIPEDAAMFIKPEIVNSTPPVLCETIYQKIGDAQLNALPIGPGSAKRRKLAAGAVNCLKRNPNRNFTVLKEADVVMIGKLICEVPVRYYVNMTEGAFHAALENVRKCMHTFTKDHIAELQILTYTYFGKAESWDEVMLASLGPLLSLMAVEDIQHTTKEYFAASFDETIPPKVDETLEVYPLIHYDAYYKKAAESLADVAKEEEQYVATTIEGLRRERRQDEEFEDDELRTAVRTPVYDVIASLGSGNSQWTVEELKRISNGDVIAALDTLGSVDDWSTAQMNALLERIDEALALRMTDWSTSVIADAKHILTGLTATQISTLDISTLETTTSLSDVEWSRAQRKAAFDRFMELNGKNPDEITAQDIAGLGNIFCGMSENSMVSIAGSEISNGLKNIGELTCYSRDQLDVLYSLVELESGTPDGSLIQAMGSIAAGMQTEDLREISVSNMPLLSVGAIKLMDPLRFKNAMSTTQLSAAGVINVAAIIAKESLYNALTVQQRNKLQVTAYGDEAVLETEAIGPGGESVTIDVFADGDTDGNIFNQNGVTSDLKNDDTISVACTTKLHQLLAILCSFLALLIK